MLNTLFENVEWRNIKNVGFDLDGTLYDEFDFIEQVYESIAQKYGYQIKGFMLNRWLEKGSSYPFIYKETYNNFLKDLSEISQEDFVNDSLDIFRNFVPVLTLSIRTNKLLNYFKDKYNVFLITDGNLKLQKNKVNALCLYDFFEENDLVFTSNTGLPKNDLSIDKIFPNINPKETVFFGDRDIDEEFAKKSGINFIKVYNMIKV